MIFFSGLLFSEETFTTTRGFYLGLNPGFRMMKIKWTANTQTSSENNTINRQIIKSGGGEGFVGRLDLGYGIEFKDKFYLALNLFGDASSAHSEGSVSTNINGEQIIHSYKFSHLADLGLGLRPGINIFSKCFVFMDLSYINGYFKSETNRTGNIHPFSTSSKEWYSGFEIGLGTKLDFSNSIQHLFVGVEAHYHGFETKNRTQSITGSNGEYSRDYSDKPSGMDVSFSITYLF